MKTLQDREQYWNGLGYTERKEFPGEYVLRVRPIDMARVRIYGHGTFRLADEPGFKEYHIVEEP